MGAAGIILVLIVSGPIIQWLAACIQVTHESFCQKAPKASWALQMSSVRAWNLSYVNNLIVPVYV